MRGELAETAHEWVAAVTPPRIRPSATFPQGGRLFLLVLLALQHIMFYNKIEYV